MATKRDPHASRNASKTTLANLEELVVIEMRAESVELTGEERKFLEDPEWITEDEADVIVSERIYRREGHLAKPIREYLKERGIKMEG